MKISVGLLFGLILGFVVTVIGVGFEVIQPQNLGLPSLTSEQDETLRYVVMVSDSCESGTGDVADFGTGDVQ